MEIFRKTLTKNDVGSTGSHQAGLHIPKRNKELINFLPYLDHSIKNPSVFFKCIDDDNIEWMLRYIYYNNKFYDENGTRDEFRITHTNSFFKSKTALENDDFEISKPSDLNCYKIKLIKKDGEAYSNEPIKLKGWNKVY